MAQPTVYANLTIAGGPAPVRAYMHELLPDVLDGVPDGYRAMNDPGSGIRDQGSGIRDP